MLKLIFIWKLSIALADIIQHIFDFCEILIKKISATRRTDDAFYSNQTMFYLT